MWARAILTAIDTPVARNGLISLALAGKGIGHQQEICGLIVARVLEPDSLIEEIRSRASGERKRYLYSSQFPAPLAYRFYQKWPQIGKNSLPRSLPVDLWK